MTWTVRCEARTKGWWAVKKYKAKSIKGAEPVCPRCKGTRKVHYRGRELICGACATDSLSVAFRKAIAKAEQGGAK